MIIEISKRRFDAYCYSRAPVIRFILNEVAWYASDDMRILGVVSFDLTDNDYGCVILGRDKRNVFRAISLPKKFYSRIGNAKRALKILMQEVYYSGETVWEQGDEKALPNELLIPKIKPEKMHPYFKMMIEAGRYEAARELLKEIAYSYVDVDGNYIKDFQSTGFDARLWELYLYIFLHSEGYYIDRSHAAPDYNISYRGIECAIEAVTVNASSQFDEPPPTSPNEVIELSRDYMPIKFGSPLYSKLNKRYWEKKHVKGKSLIFAIHDYHQAGSATNFGSMVWSRAALMDYLYGIRLKYKKNEAGEYKIEWEEVNGEKEPMHEVIGTHNWKGKTIPSNFFDQPEAENVSAVLFSNGATIATFNRMGKLAGMGSKEVKMIRQSIIFDPSSENFEPIMKSQDIDHPDYEESWADTLVMYHNPKAKYPVDLRMFPMISHVHFDPKTFHTFSRPAPNAVLGSFTVVIQPTS